ncbi:MAG TPA: hypothetical protein IGS31_01510 [Oscillatoriales cyanobacterium M4454_W2019_049]|nr:hypothetical protein [Oscillatoriales cyanobacterium M4454_W2019_049]
MAHQKDIYLRSREIGATGQPPQCISVGTGFAIGKFSSIGITQIRDRRPNLGNRHSQRHQYAGRFRVISHNRTPSISALKPVN